MGAPQRAGSLGPGPLLGRTTHCEGLPEARGLRGYAGKRPAIVLEDKGTEERCSLNTQSCWTLSSLLEAGLLSMVVLWVLHRSVVLNGPHL